MSVTNSSSTAPSLRRLPFTIRLSPQFVNRLLSRRQVADVLPGRIHGLLFGMADENLLVVQAFRSFVEDEDVSGAPQGKAFEGLLTGARKDPEIAPLELVGWYAMRASGGLLQSDVQFHDLHFKRPSDLALVLKPEGNMDVLMELYCRSVNGVLSSEGHRWGAVRQTRGAALVGPVEVTMRAKIQDDFFLRAYQVSSPETEDDDVSGWKSTIQFTAKKALGWLVLSRGLKMSTNSEAAQDLTKISETAALREEVSRSQTTANHQRQFHPDVREDDKALTTAAVFKQLTGTPSHNREGENSKGTSIQKIRAGAPPSVPALIPETSRRYKIPWVSSALIFAVAAGLTFGLVYSRGLSSGDYTPGFLKGLFSTPGLGLRLESQGDRVLLSWNRHHPVVRNAAGGVLQIDDGSQHRSVSLDAVQVSNGSVLYRPMSGDVTFRLDVEGVQGGKISESMRVLEGAPPNTLDLSKPATMPLETHSTGQTARTVVPRSTDANIPGTDRATTDKPVTNAPSAYYQSQPLRNIPATPTMQVPTEVQTKPKTELPGQANFDVLPTTPLQTGNSESSAHTIPAPNNQAQKNTPRSYQAPHPLQQVLPNTTQLAPGILAAAGRVEVVVKVDGRGRVIDAHLVNGSRQIDQGLAGASIFAAKQWKFEPALLNGKPVASEHSIVFQFQPSK